MYFFYKLMIQTIKEYFPSYCKMEHLPLVNIYNLVIKIYRGNLIHSNHHRYYHRSFPR